MSNRVFVNDEGIVEIVFEGDQHKDNFHETIVAADKLQQERRDKGLPVRTLNDISKMGELDLPVIYESIKRSTDRNYDKSALFGDYKPDSSVVARLLKDIGKFGEGRARHFLERKEAIEWLLS